MSDEANVTESTETSAPEPATEAPTKELSPKDRAAALIDDRMVAHLAKGKDVEEPAPEEPPAEEEASTEAAAEEQPEDEKKPEDEWTPEKITVEKAKLDEERTKVETERREVNQLRIKQQRHAAQIADREEKLKRKINGWKEEKTRQDNFVGWVTNRLDAIQRGDAAARLQALGDLTRQDPLKVYEDFSLHIAGNGKPAAKAQEIPELAQMRAEIEAMKREKAEAARREQENRERQTDEEHARNWKAVVAEEAKTSLAHPHLAKIAQGDPDLIAEEAYRIAMSFYQQNGRAIDRPSLLGKLEEKLKKLSELSHRDAQTVETETTAPVADTDLGTVAAAKPEAPQRPAKGQSIPQSLGGGGRTRPMTAEERKRRAADLLPDTLLKHVTG